jgi:hypothetical protein
LQAIIAYHRVNIVVDIRARPSYEQISPKVFLLIQWVSSVENRTSRPRRGFWRTNYDLNHEKAKQSRIKLLELAYKDNMLVNAFHFDFPGLGRIDKFENNWIWKYSEK